MTMPPSLTEFTPDERRLIRRLSSPRLVQAYLNSLPYNSELPPVGETLRSFRGVVGHRTAHCLEAALSAAVILEQHGYPPLVLSFESIDKLDHVLFVYRHRGRWGSVARSRDPGLHGRKPVFRSARALAQSYFEPYIDFSGCVTAFAVVNLQETLGGYDWRLSEKNVWKAEQMLIDYPHSALPYRRVRERRLRARYEAFRERHPDRKPLDYPGRERWTALPAPYTHRGYFRPWP
jgi:hypothetical protein